MQIKVRKLREALELLGPVVPKKATLPVLTNVLLKDGKAMATDLEIAVALELPEAEGQCVLPYRPVADLLKRVPGAGTLTLEQEGKKLNLAWPGGRASYDAPEPEDYPPFPKVKARVEQAVDGDTLVPALLQVADYCATKEDRPVLTGVALVLGENLEVAGADGFRLAHRTLSIAFPAVEDLQEVIIPVRAVRVLAHLWEKTPRVAPLESSLIAVVTARRQLELALGNGQLEARFGPATLIARLIQGSPPNYRQLIPEDTPQKVRVMAPDFERAVRQVREMAKDNVRLIWSETEMTVRAVSEDKGELEVVIPVETDGGPGRTAVNISYLLDYLRGKEGLVTMGIAGPTSPILFLHSASPLVLIMPMSVQWPSDEADRPEEPSEDEEPVD